MFSFIKFFFLTSIKPNHFSLRL